VGPALQTFIEKDRRQTFQPVLQSVFCLLVTPQNLTRQNFFEVKKISDDYLVQGQDCIENDRKFPKRTVWGMRVYGRRRKFAPMPCFL